MELKRLSEKFREEDVDWRVSRSGHRNGKPWAVVVPYITNRAIMERLDSVCGQENWYNEYKDGPSGGVVCGLSIKIEEPCAWASGWVTKWDGAGNTNIEAVKGGLSGAMKRAGVQWGIGRYLYYLDDCLANFCATGKNKAKIDDNWYQWNPPSLPLWALSEPTKTKGELKARHADSVSAIFKHNESGDGLGILEVWQELDDSGKKEVWGQLPKEIHKTIKELLGV